MKVKSPAKINLTLDILGVDKTPFANHKSDFVTGYHFVDTILREIDIQDELDFQIIDLDKIIIESNDPHLPLNEQNTIHKAAVLLNEIRKKKQKKPSTDSDYTNKNRKNHSQVPYSLNINSGIKIHIQKKIPVSSGLGGGSSNAAASLKALNQLWELNLSKRRLTELAEQIGVDTPFFIEGGTAFATHYGEKITPLPSINLPPHLIAMDDQKQSTGELYKKIDSTKTGQNIAKTKELLSLLHHSGARTIKINRYGTTTVHPTGTIHAPEQPPPPSPNLPRRPTFPVGRRGRLAIHNDFDALQSPKTRALQKKLLQLEATVVHICGSGPALYALFKSETQKRKAFKELKGQVGFIWESR